MRIIFDLLRSLRPGGNGQRPDPHVWLRIFIVLFIVLFCGPEVFLAADMIALLDLLGAVLFITAFSYGYKAVGLAALEWVRRIFFPGDWAALVKARGRPTVAAHGIMLVGANALWISTFCLVALRFAFELVRGNI